MKLSLLLLTLLPLTLTVRADDDAVRPEPRGEKPPEVRAEMKEGMERFQNRMQKMMQGAMEKAARLESEGKKDEAEAVRREANEKREAAIREHQQEMQARMQKEMRERPDKPERGEKPEREGRPDGPPPGQTAEKLRHIEQAIAHLREAGLREPADDLARLAERMRQSGRPDGGPQRPGPEIEGLRQEVRELRQAVREMMEKLERR